ncbi:beta-1,6-N-acetylglucosaminyltransferase [Clostridium fungisolvens]|uniref:Peptide O-xylosyltransferase n=1 Tax=Clostridium fungisolvens TaxID=1604897 RepID=A0A6V8SBX6_9CLOT|nr:beta-1,6-N-acetylglucosaminyltransferase [Clostridium fungisolvens]GFP74206.1 hypothetical protein bsdtw1_00251 [Clostridium fungisolvens]
MGRHAYLIIAHSEFNLLKILLHMIDDERNDIFIHIDKKVKSFDRDYISREIKKSNVYFSDRINVVWGSVSQIECELMLLDMAIKGTYSYYHLLSGQDLPIKNQDYIHDFFDRNNGKEFIRFNCGNFNYYDRVKYYYFFINKIGRSKTLTSKTIRMLEKILLSIQSILKVNRIKNSNIIYQKGTNWFSITNDLAQYVIEKSNQILKDYKYTLCCDEVFLQTLVVNSPFINNLYHLKFDNDIHAIMRLIDWERGDPYIFRKEDYKDLLTSDMLFARKFSMKTDKDIVDIIYSYLCNDEGVKR